MMTPFVSAMRLTSLRCRWASVALFSILFGAGLVEAAPIGRVTRMFEGIECEYSPERTEVAQLIAHRLALHNQEILAEPSARKSTPEPVKPLSPAELRANRA